MPVESISYLRADLLKSKDRGRLHWATTTSALTSAEPRSPLVLQMRLVASW